MKRTNITSVAQAPPTGTNPPPPDTGCQRIATDQQGQDWGDMPQPYGIADWVRGQTSLAVGKFEGYVYLAGLGGLDQYLLMSQTVGAFVDGENLESGPSSTGPWTDVLIDAATPVGQVPVDCDVGCFGSECDPDQVPPTLNYPGGDNQNPTDEMVSPGDLPFDPWVGRYSYRTTVPALAVPPVLSGQLTGAISGAIAEVAYWQDVTSGFQILHVVGITLGEFATRFQHGETLDHSDSTAQVVLANPMEESGPNLSLDP